MNDFIARRSNKKKPALHPTRLNCKRNSGVVNRRQQKAYRKIAVRKGG